MEATEQMLQTHPDSSFGDLAAVIAAVESAFECAQVCTMCADACLSEEHVHALRHCIRLNMDCADICYATGRVLARQTTPDWTLIRSQLQSCMMACNLCAVECEAHANMHDHCRICAEACRRCESACNRMLTALSA